MNYLNFAIQEGIKNCDRFIDWSLNVDLSKGCPDYMATLVKVATWSALVMPTLSAAFAKYTLIYSERFFYKTYHLTGSTFCGIKSFWHAEPEKKALGYDDLSKVVNDFNKNNQNRAERNAWLNPFEKYIVTPITEKLAPPIYKFAKSVLQPMLPTDPISTRNLLRIGQVVETQSLKVAKKEATEVPVLSTGHKAAITVGRHVHTLAKDFNTLLGVADTTRTKVGQIFGAVEKNMVPDFEVQEQPLGANDTSWKQWFSHHAKNLIALSAIKGKEKVLVPLKEKTEQFINDKEKMVREKVVAKIADNVGDKSTAFAIRWTVRTAVMGVIAKVWEQSCLYFLDDEPESFCAETLPYTTAKTVFVGSLILWGMALLPTIKHLAKDYEKGFSDKTTFFTKDNLVAGLKQLPQALASKLYNIESISLPSLENTTQKVRNWLGSYQS